MSVEVKGMVPLLAVFDMQRSLDFYCKGLGFEIKESAGPADDIGWVYLQLGNVELMLNTLYEMPDRPSHPDELQNKHHADTALYFGCPDVEACYAALKARGIATSEPYVTGYGWKAIDLKDPDGYHICFQWPVGN